MKGLGRAESEAGEIRVERVEEVVELAEHDRAWHAQGGGVAGRKPGVAEGAGGGGRRLIAPVVGEAGRGLDQRCRQVGSGDIPSMGVKSGAILGVGQNFHRGECA